MIRLKKLAIIRSFAEKASVKRKGLQKQNTNKMFMLVGMASEISKNYTYKCVDRSRHNGIKGAKAKCAH